MDRGMFQYMALGSRCFHLDPSMYLGKQCHRHHTPDLQDTAVLQKDRNVITFSKSTIALSLEGFLSMFPNFQLTTLRSVCYPTARCLSSRAASISINPEVVTDQALVQRSCTQVVGTRFIIRGGIYDVLTQVEGT